MCALVLMFCVTRHAGWARKIMMGTPASAEPVLLNNGNLSADPRLALLPQSRSRSTGGETCVDMEDTEWTITGAKASCTELQRYCSHTTHGSGIKQVCPATCGVCSGGCADGCGWTKKWPCPEDATESANDVCFNLCCTSFTPPMPPLSFESWNRPWSGFREVYSIIAICTSFASFVFFAQEPIRPTGLPIVILSIIFLFLLYALLFALTIVDCWYLSWFSWGVEPKPRFPPRSGLVAPAPPRPARPPAQVCDCRPMPFATAFRFLWPNCSPDGRLRRVPRTEVPAGSFDLFCWMFVVFL